MSRYGRCDLCKTLCEADETPYGCTLKGTLKAWPEAQDETVSYTDLVEPVVEAIEFCYDMERRNKGTEVPYSGYALPGTAGTFPTCETFAPENMDYSDDEQGYPALHQWVGEAVRVGMEHQRRLMLSDRGATFGPQSGYGRYRSEYSVSAAIEEALEECGLTDHDEAARLDTIVRHKLRDLDGLEALHDRQNARVEASLAKHREELAADPERAAQWNRMIDRLLSGQSPAEIVDKMVEER